MNANLSIPVVLVYFSFEIGFSHAGILFPLMKLRVSVLNESPSTILLFHEMLKLLARVVSGYRESASLRLKMVVTFAILDRMRSPLCGIWT
jgi:hypothetical protein